MNEQSIWDLIDSDHPRVWEVFVNGHWFAREPATSAEDLFRQCVGWLRDAYRFESRHGDTVEAMVEVQCKATSERAKSCLRVEV